MSIVEQNLLTLTEQLISLIVFGWVRVAQSLIFFDVFCVLCIVCWYFYFNTMELSVGFFYLWVWRSLWYLFVPLLVVSYTDGYSKCLFWFEIFILNSKRSIFNLLKTIFFFKFWKPSIKVYMCDVDPCIPLH